MLWSVWPIIYEGHAFLRSESVFFIQPENQKRGINSLRLFRYTGRNESLGRENQPWQLYKHRTTTVEPLWLQIFLNIHSTKPDSWNMSLRKGYTVAIFWLLFFYISSDSFHTATQRFLSSYPGSLFNDPILQTLRTQFLVKYLYQAQLKTTLMMSCNNIIISDIWSHNTTVFTESKSKLTFMRKIREVFLKSTTTVTIQKNTLCKSVSLFLFSILF